MKKVILFLAAILIASCSQRNPQLVSVDEAIENQQGELIAYLYKYKQLKEKANNSIQRDELWEQREDSLVILQDKVGVFHNIVGRIDKIRATDVRDSKVLDFTIEVEPEQYFKIRLECKHLVNKDSIDTDSLYNLVKSLPDYSLVYVDGAIAITSDCKPVNSSWGDKDLQFSYPEYSFNVVALSTSPLPEISAHVRNAIIMWRKGFESILKNGQSAETDEKIAAYKKATENLSPADEAYIAKYVQACSIDLYRE